MESTAWRGATTFPCISYIFRKRVNKVIMSEEKWRVFEGWWRNFQKWWEVQNWEQSALKWSEKWIDDPCVKCVYYHSLISVYLYVCSVQYVVSLLSVSVCHSLVTQHMFLNILLYLFSCFVCLFSILCILCFCIVLCIVSPFVYSCLFPIFVKVYLPLPPGGNTVAVNKYQLYTQQPMQFIHWEL